MFGMKDAASGRLHRKDMGLLTNSEAAKALVAKTCVGGHDHESIEGNVVVNGRRVARSRLAQKYPPGLVRWLARVAEIEVEKKMAAMVISEITEYSVTYMPRVGGGAKIGHATAGSASSAFSPSAWPGGSLSMSVSVSGTVTSLRSRTFSQPCSGWAFALKRARWSPTSSRLFPSPPSASCLRPVFSRSLGAASPWGCRVLCNCRHFRGLRGPAEC